MKTIIIATTLLVAGCSGNYPHTVLPSFVKGTHLAAGQYVNQDCVVNGPMAYGWTATKAAAGCAWVGVKEWAQ